MSHSLLTSVIITYKGKILLLCSDIISLDRIQKNLWHFIFAPAENLSIHAEDESRKNSHFSRKGSYKLGKSPASKLEKFIGGEKIGKEPEDKAIARRIKYITRLDLKNIHRLKTSSENKKNFFYHAELTDQEVNSMERRDGQRLEFYTLRELEGLTLTDTTADFLEEYRNAVEEVLVRKATLQM